MRRLCLFLVIGVLAAAPAAAQDPIPVIADSLSDSTAFASATDSSTTDRLLALEGQDRELLPVMPRVGFGDLQPAGTRVVLTRDSIEWAPARTVGELIAATTGAYLWRGGWLLQSEVPNFFGRGAGGVEYFFDGREVLAVGPDSLGVDPTTWSLELIDRVEIERLPGSLRVFVYSPNHDRAAPATRIGIATGDRGFAQYLAAFDKRYPSGLGLSIAADYTNVNPPTDGTGGANLTNGMARLSFQPSHRLGAELTVRVTEPNRDPLLASVGGISDPDTLSPGLVGRRTDSQLRVAWRGLESPFGWRVDGWMGKTSWRSDSLSHDVGSFGTVIGFRRPTTSAEFKLSHHTEWTAVDSRLALGFSPSNFFSASVEGGYQSHSADRTSKWFTARVGSESPSGFRIGAMTSVGERVDAPAVLDLEPQSFADYHAYLGFRLGPLQLEGRFTSTDVWQPLPFRSFARITSLGRQPRIEWLGAEARLAPTSWLAIASRYEHPQSFIIPDGMPPHHAWTTVTVNSRFLRNFPSGIFRLKVQGVVETWSPGIIGRDAGGDPIAMPGLTFVRGVIQFKIGPFTAFWDRVNFQATDGGTVPGYPIFSLGSSYGIRWSFSN